MGEPSVTSRLKVADPLWWWLRENFKLPSLITIALSLATSAAWLYTQHADLAQFKAHDPGPQLEAIASKLSAVLQAQSAMQQRLDDFSQRIDSQERRWEHVESVADTPPRRFKRAR